jgi:uncharacterized protein YndB with AHSA1/START domain
LHHLQEVRVIRRQVVMPVSPEQLWEALTDPDQVAGWFGGRIEWELREGGPAHFSGDDGSERHGRVETVRPGRHLRFRWWPADGNNPRGTRDPAAGHVRPGDGNAAGRDDEAEVSEITYVLEPDGNGTRLTIQERQVAGSPAIGSQACAGDSPTRWTVWDDRLGGAWAALAAPASRLVRA